MGASASNWSIKLFYFLSDVHSDVLMGLRFPSTPQKLVPVSISKGICHGYTSWPCDFDLWPLIPKTYQSTLLPMKWWSILVPGMVRLKFRRRFVCFFAILTEKHKPDGSQIIAMSSPHHSNIRHDRYNVLPNQSIKNLFVIYVCDNLLNKTTQSCLMLIFFPQLKELW